MAPAGASWLGIPLAESEIYGYVEVDGTLQMTNVQTDQRFRPAELHVRRLSHRVSEQRWKRRLTGTRSSFTYLPGCSWQ